MELKLEQILQKYIEDFKSHNQKTFVVKNSIPIVWFGDLNKYENSQKKIVTVAINPSKNEFSTYPNKTRFDIIQGNELNSINLSQTLNNYFYDNPYRRWFDVYEKMLNNINASYYQGKKDNIAIHIDCYTAIATDPTWGCLEKAQQKELSRTDLFMELLDYLNPEIILISIKKEDFRNVFGMTDKKIIAKSNTLKENKMEIYEYKQNKKILFGRNNYGSPFRYYLDNEIKIFMRLL